MTFVLHHEFRAATKFFVITFQTFVDIFQLYHIQWDGLQEEVGRLRAQLRQAEAEAAESKRVLGELTESQKAEHANATHKLREALTAMAEADGGLEADGAAAGGTDDALQEAERRYAGRRSLKNVG